jgi:hypothetical protein
VRRHSDDDEFRVAQSVAEIGGHAKPIGKRDVRQVDGIRPASTKLVDKRRIAAPQTRVVSRPTEVNGKCRPPPAGTQYGYPPNTRLPV